MHKMHKEEEVTMQNQEESNKSFYSISMKYLTFHYMKSVIFTTLELSISFKMSKIVYKIDTGSDGNLMPFQILKILFPRSTMAELNATTNRSIMLKTYIQSNRTLEWMLSKDKTQ